ncbi:phenylalanine--tRNA ligase subunit beta [Kocuria sp. JC486]|uniref:phenylalanine--tRNA ligase subunit beta n=1 Tax=Kocuria sp. JC486 TaxID=1970736 RepID=UPI001423F293|nr:phenylalanine--tRNA ligase subunit beta [Kocuria sp. JC486]NHU85190.1 phenylalanine--tRNA ligase subunit beta [Kocuria sp. JC486]
MRIPLSWLREYAPVPEGATAEQVLETMVSVGFEEEEVHRPSDEISGPVVVGQVLSREPEEHSNGKTVNWCQVRVVPEGQEQSLTGKGIEPSGVQGIVCGAHNFEVGDKVVVTLPGAVLPGDFRITPRKTYGHTSAGMIASVRELGIGDDHDGILVLSRIGLDPELGTDALELLGLHDEAAEINVTPDRGYGFSIRGVAREYCHAVNEPFHDFVLDAAGQAPESTADGGFPVELADQAPINGVPGCDRFVTRVVKGIDPSRPTPTWLASRLRLAGIRSLSLPVDISNYVMLEFGQPLHFYDLAKVNQKIVVRRAQAGEKLTTLDDKQRTLDAEDLLITDASGPIGIAGVMGGATTEVGADTTDVLVEAAHFDPITIARSARRHRLPSEASKRFERSVDPEIQAAAAQRAVDLLVELAGGTAEPGAGEVRVERPQSEPVRLPAGYVTERVGVDYTRERIEELLTRIGCTVQRAESNGADGDAAWLVTPPSWRADLIAPEDLAEEVARLDGYDKIPSRLPIAPPGRGLTRRQVGRKRVLTSLAAAGLTEVLSYPFVAAEENTLWGAPSTEAAVAGVQLHNPISEAKGRLRVSVLPGLLDTLRRNHARGFRDLALFEAGLVFLPGSQVGSAHVPPGAVQLEQSVLDDINAGIPDQPLRLGVVLAGNDAATAPGVTAHAYNWQDALDDALLVGQALGVRLTVAQGKHQAFHPGRTAELTTPAGEHVGWAGELHPQVVQQLNLPDRTCAAELDLDVVMGAQADGVQAQSLSVQTAATQDVALLVDAELPAAALVDTLAEGAGDLLEDVRVFDVYEGDRIESGKKSVALAMRFRAPDRTLTADEASASRQAAVDLAAQRHGAVLRG